MSIKYALRIRWNFVVIFWYQVPIKTCIYKNFGIIKKVIDIVNDEYLIPGIVHKSSNNGNYILVKILHATMYNT